MLLLSVSSVALHAPQHLSLQAQQHMSLEDVNLTCPTWCGTSTDLWSSKCTWGDGCEVCDECPQCEPGYKLACTLDIADTECAKFASSGWAGNNAEWTDEQIADITAKCSSAVSTVTSLIGDLPDTYDKKLKKACQKELKTKVYCLLGSSSDLRKCAANRPLPIDEKMNTVVDTDNMSEAETILAAETAIHDCLSTVTQR